MPCIVSGNHFGMFDPHKIYFHTRVGNSTGKQWKLSRDSKAKVPVGHTLPYLGICDCDATTFTEGNYPGTLFRFPLRQKKSSLSDTIYDDDKVKDLFKSFMYDAHLLLLFLKNVEHIELCVKTERSDESTCQFAVNIVSECLDDVKTKRKKFTDQIKHNTLNKKLGDEALHISYLLIIETKHYTQPKGCVACVYKYLVTEYCAGGKISKQLHDLSIDTMLGHIPLVGVAMSITDAIITNDVEQNGTTTSANELPADIAIDKDVRPIQVKETHGQVFCFLPLPIQQKSASGLPVHVNGYFAVGQDRCSLKWASGDLESAQMDKSILWNRCLLTELIPTAYDMMVMFAIEHSKEHCIDSGYVMRALPDESIVNEKWRVIVPILYETLLQKSVFFSQACRGKWLSAADSLFDCTVNESDEMMTLLRGLYTWLTSLILLVNYIR